MPKMVAMAVPHAGGNFERVEREIPQPGPTELLIRVHACGVCHSDTVTVEGLMPGIQYPRVPGHEVIGTVEQVGTEVHGWAVGSRVGVGWFGGSCGHCSRCRRANAFACENVHAATGVTRDGGYASHMVADASAAAHVPDELDSIAAAPLLCAGITTFNALRNCGARAGDIVAIHGIGGLGHLGVQFANRLGFRTIAVNRGREKEQLARSLGAHEYIDSALEDAADALQKMGGAAAIIATVTNAEAMQAIAGGLGPNGTLMAIGVVGEIAVDTLALLSKRAAVKGWYSGVAVDSEDTLAFSVLNDVSSMNEVFPFADAQAAYDRMKSGKARFRVVLQM
ncbi:alcohol dehydrogenase catalytic domain-containing protein [Paracraurococcus lichenis]|uniref:Alcohol dehydrogenase catalytic domain-containing protein n=1 Tax=Paracraurococcus lichenis TaxID=3064888 RepID=A0ABT9EB06_9PROT|nr:alcohol dehydrogenase catalytic domain-containing protein [Paracraurococcus sp. LOR1-02]MDO9713279.1 alcohol dehydrogenase catalytic domain-containing protein [Paracraurococcus sp. LOR1-02]